MPPPRPPQSDPVPDHGTTRAVVLDAAADRFSRFGPRKTTMQEIARTAGLSRATVYTHFRSKAALYAALLDRVTDDFVGRVEDCLDEPGDARHKLRRIVEITREVYSGSPVLLHALTGDDETQIAAVAAEAMGRHEQRVIALLTRVLEEGVRTGAIRAVDPRATAYLMYHLGHLLVAREVSGRGDFPFRSILDAMDDLINHGLAKPASRRRRNR